MPVLCFHQLREFRPDDSAYARTLITPPAVFTAQLQALRDGGWTPIPAARARRPPTVRRRPARAPGAAHLRRRLGDPPLGGPAGAHRPRLPATFFPKTVVLDKPDWLSRDQVRDLDRAGITIGAHTWDHQRLDRIGADAWATQLDQPKAELAEVLGHPVDLLAYPFGVWSPEALSHVAAAGYRAAFQLSDPQDPAQPLLTIRRIMPPPT